MLNSFYQAYIHPYFFYILQNGFEGVHVLRCFRGYKKAIISHKG